MDVANGDVKLDKEQLKEALKDLSDDDLRQVGKRVEKSCEDFEQSLKDLQQEQNDLKEENAQLHKTIELMMENLKKLNIGAMNVNEPELEEDAVAFVGRMWEKLRPREMAAPVSEHIGEIEKPTPGSETNVATATAKRLSGQLTEGINSLSSSIEEATGGGVSASLDGVKQVAERGEELRKQAELRAEALRKEAAEKAEELSKQVAERSQEIGKHAVEFGQELVEQGEVLKKQVAGRLSFLYGAPQDAESSASADATRSGSGEHTPNRGQDLRESVMGHISGAFNFFKQEADESNSPKTNSVFQFFQGASWPSYGGYPASGGKNLSKDETAVASEVAAVLRPDLSRDTSSASGALAAAEGSIEPQGKAAPAAAASASGGESAAAAAPAKEEEADGRPSGKAAAKAQRSPPAAAAASKEPLSTLMIEARLTLGAGSEIMVAEVRAADRPKDVAARFIRDHSLKAWYEAPLINFLKASEASAESFPVKVEADLDDIRKQYSSKKT
eukprot:TRINITY_DN14311_c0_g2_i1.p1 TRINITY_DN14311_c0_g2~~TRINITY_DN14311_c0_g2_i1.p1  ORF type:complete len:516 (+),score=131.90 TRINITY_DN14311_c0_g2_i1:40-1548(+)